MGFIHLENKIFESFIDEDTISEKVKELSNAIQKDFHNEEPVFLSILNGAFMFTADLMKEYKGKCLLSFIKLSSYHGFDNSSNVKTLIGLENDLKGKSVIVIEDIVDTGKTLVKIIETIKEQNPKKIKVCSLFFKPEAYKESISVDYIGMKIPNYFIVGYGLDYNGFGRNLSHIYKFKK